MNKQRKVLVTITYNELGIIIDTKTEEVAQPVDKDIDVPSTDTISRQAAIDVMADAIWHYPNEKYAELNDYENARRLADYGLSQLPSAQPERLTDDDFETIRIHLNACKEKLCNQRRWKEAEEYQHIIDRFMAFASAQPEIIRCGECVYFNKENSGEMWCGISNGFGIDENSFCSFAERRTENADVNT